jgi:hypothetical protein
MSRRNEVLLAITNVLDEAMVAYVVRHGGKHLQVVFTVNGRNQKCICPVSPSDVNARHNARAHVRRMLRETAPI